MADRIDYFLRRQKELSNYKGTSERLKSILYMDACEGVKTEISHNVERVEKKQLKTREEFFRENGGDIS